MVICLEQGADLHTAQLMSLPLTLFSVKSRLVSGFTFLVLAHSGSPGQKAIKWVCVSLIVMISVMFSCFVHLFTCYFPMSYAA